MVKHGILFESLQGHGACHFALHRWTRGMITVNFLVLTINQVTLLPSSVFILHLLTSSIPAIVRTHLVQLFIQRSRKLHPSLRRDEIQSVRNNELGARPQT